MLPCFERLADDLIEHFIQHGRLTHAKGRMWICGSIIEAHGGDAWVSARRLVAHSSIRSYERGKSKCSVL
jgi:hypothetical protein